MPDPRTYVVTGADSGLGRAVAALLATRGRVITCGLADGVDVRADLTTAEGRADLVGQVRSLTGGRVDGLVAAAGAGAPRAETVALNYFGATAVLEGLRDCLAASDAPAAVVVSSSSTLNRGSGALVRACRSGDEPRALALAGRLVRTGRGSQLYRSSKAALNLWTRATAVSPSWARAGIVLNAVAPGIVATDVVTRTWERDRALLETALPQPLGAPGPVAPVADLLAFLVSRENRFMTGQVVYCDGGTDALTRGGRPQRVYLRYGVREMATMWREARRRPPTP
ncbi:SDR family oxidoreductase [Krasilnikoviella flava]|uniref:NAD(P)-dependent dehydrogenase, short-chain alcohol dehydrogenase family n=1 Tax=Krasilnikoviella flava TaxID=526729 RepID=A0A1T5LYC1_9MICO|nr:SDR family oxidoreductase [Krasilnikoviella flava]SKC80863.1 NAD(P)-dependent dehydrogenase, short-chain alcohol dehydrogenase family [Krasilnikoviella flava]